MADTEDVVLDASDINGDDERAEIAQEAAAKDVEGEEEAGETSAAAGSSSAAPRRPRRERITTMVFPEGELTVPPAPKRYTAPDMDVVTKQLEELDKQIKALFEARQAARQAFRKADRAVKSQPKEVREKIMPLVEKKKELNEVLKGMKGRKEELQKALDELIDQEKRVNDVLSNIKKNIEFTRIQDLDREIASLERQMEGGELSSVSAESQAVKKIRRLKEARENVLVLEREAETSKRLRKDQQAVRADVNAKRNEMSRVYEEIVAIEKQIEKIKADADAESNSNKPDESAYEAQDQALQKQIEDLKLQKKSIWQKFKDDRVKYREAEDAFYKWKDESYLINKEIKRRERIAAEASRREEIKKQLLVNPHEQDVELCDSMIGYLTRLLPQEGAASSSSAASSSGPVDVAASGLAVLKLGKNADREFDELGYLNETEDASTRSQKGKKKVRQQKPKDEVVTHTIDKFAGFNRLGVPAPLTRPQIPAAIEAIKACREKYSKWEMPTEEKLAELIEKAMKEDEEDYQRRQERRDAQRGSGGGRGRGRGGSAGGRGRGRDRS